MDISPQIEVIKLRNYYDVKYINMYIFRFNINIMNTSYKKNYQSVIKENSFL